VGKGGKPPPRRKRPLVPVFRESVPEGIDDGRSYLSTRIDTKKGSREREEGRLYLDLVQGGSKMREAGNVVERIND